MASPIQFYRNFQALMRQHGIRHVLTSGMACVEYGIQQNTKDTDWIVHPEDLPALVAMLAECERGLTGANWQVSYQNEWKEFYRRWQKDRVGEWPTSEPFAEQHRGVARAAEEHGLPPAPFSGPEQKSELFDRAVQRASALMAATPKELEAVLFPITEILP